MYLACEQCGQHNLCRRCNAEYYDDVPPRLGIETDNKQPKAANDPGLGLMEQLRKLVQGHQSEVTLNYVGQ